jgi:hypothetical protein
MGINEDPAPAHQERAGSPTHWSESGFNDDSQVSCSKIKPRYLTNNTIGCCSISSY